MMSIPQLEHIAPNALDRSLGSREGGDLWATWARRRSSPSWPSPSSSASSGRPGRTVVSRPPSRRRPGQRAGPPGSPGRRERLRHRDQHQSRASPSAAPTPTARVPAAGIDYGEWNKVTDSDTSNGDAEYYAFGNPQPTFDPTTNALTNLSVQVVGAAHDHVTPNHYLFDTETSTSRRRTASSPTCGGRTSSRTARTATTRRCTYNWKRRTTTPTINGSDSGCGPVYFGPTTICSARPSPMTPSSSAATAPAVPSFGNPSTIRTCPRPSRQRTPTACSSTATTA